MKRKKLIIYITLLVVSSCNQQNTAKLEEALKTTIKQNNCYFKLKENNNTKEIEIQSQCDNDLRLFYGKVLFDFIQNLENEKLVFNNYTIKDSNGSTIQSFTRNHFFEVKKRKILFDKLTEDVQKGQILTLYNLFTSELKNSISKEKLTSEINKLSFENNHQFEGLDVFSNTNIDYVGFSSIIGGKSRFTTTFSMEQVDSIYGFTIN
ncbi:MAG: hypothetical protein V4638_09290 [Bacteroidota bacterium]